MDFSKCPVCGCKQLKTQYTAEGDLFWVRFNCLAIYERRTEELDDWSMHSPCLGPPRTLILSANSSFATDLKAALAIESLTANSIEDAKPLFSSINIDTVVTDLFLPQENIQEFLSILKNLRPGLKIVLCLSNGVALDMVSKQFSYDKGVSKEQSFQGMANEVNRFIAGDSRAC